VTEFVFSLLFMIAVVGGLSVWAYRKDRRIRRAREN
jgi:cbb3-type cytochrome oxidase subunit 3